MADATPNVPSQIIAVGEHEWKSLSPAIKAKLLWSDSATGRRVQMTRFEPGAKLPMHRHVGDELLYVIEGAISDESGTVTAGNVSYRPNGCVHSVTCSNGATILAIIRGQTEPATVIGDAPRSQTFVLSEIPWSEAMPLMRHKPVWQDKETNSRLSLIRFEPGAKLARHRHVGDELIFMIEGSNADESGEVATGNMNYRPNGCVHSVWSKNGATVLGLVTGGAEPISE